ncbi:MAG TPA: hypothetical protein VGM82_01555 [Gemmatimonadaceae bacterium]
MTDNDKPFVAPIAMIAGATGARCMTGLAAVAHARTQNPDALGSTAPGRHLDRGIAKLTAALAVGELVGDKMPFAGDRIAPAGIVGRVIAGAVVGAAVANITGRERRNAAIGGAVAAFVGAHLSFQFRRALTRHMPPLVAALVEDVAVIGLAAAGTTLLGPRRPAIKVDSGKESAVAARRRIATARILTESTGSSQSERVPS